MKIFDYATDFLKYAGFVITGFIVFLVSIFYLASLSLFGAASAFVISVLMLYTGIKRIEQSY